MARSSAIAAAVVGVGAAVGLFVASAGEKPGVGPDQAALTRAAAAVDAALRETVAGVKSRATTLGQLPRLVAGVATDKATVADLRPDELGFRPQSGESIEIGQVFKDGRVEVLRRLPEDMTMAPPLDQPGEHLLVDGTRLVVTWVVSITPSERADELKGAVAVAQVVDVKPLIAELDALGVAARVELDGKVMFAGSKAPVAGATTASAALASPMGKNVKVVAEVLPATRTRSAGMLAGAAAAALLGLGAAVVLARRPAGATGASAGGAGAGAGASAGGAGSGATGVVPPAGAGGASTSSPPLSPREAQQLGSAQTEVSSSDVKPLSSARTPRPSLAVPAAGAGAGAPAATFGRYTLLKPLGAGGMAEVYLARATGEAGFEKLVALKIMHANLSTQDKVVDLFLDEARLVARLTHPNIVQIADLGREGTDYFIAMEYIDGWDLDKLVRAARAAGEPVPLRVALTVLRKICDGLHAAHTAIGADGKPLDLVHRDVKSENVLIARTGAVKVGDFGIAKANQQVHKTQLGELKGTAAYMAPEHRTGQDVDRRADLYGVGAIAYEVLTGQEINLDLALIAHLGRQGWPHLAPPSKVRSELPAELDAIVFKALAYDRDDRYPTCEALEEALEAISTRYGLTASDKVVAQWVEATIARAKAATELASAG